MMKEALLEAVKFTPFDLDDDENLSLTFGKTSGGPQGLNQHVMSFYIPEKIRNIILRHCENTKTIGGRIFGYY